MVLTDVGPTGEQPNTQVTKAGKSDWDFLHNNSVSFKIAVSVTFITFQSAALLILLMRVSSLRSVDFFLDVCKDESLQLPVWDYSDCVRF